MTDLREAWAALVWQAVALVGHLSDLGLVKRQARVRLAGALRALFPEVWPRCVECDAPVAFSTHDGRLFDYCETCRSLVCECCGDTSGPGDTSDWGHDEEGMDFCPPCTRAMQEADARGRN